MEERQSNPANDHVIIGDCETYIRICPRLKLAKPVAHTESAWVELADSDNDFSPPALHFHSQAQSFK